MGRDAISDSADSESFPSPTCVITLKGETGPQGAKLELDKGCSAALPFTRGIVAWSVKGLSGNLVRIDDNLGRPRDQRHRYKIPFKIVVEIGIDRRSDGVMSRATNSSSDRILVFVRRLQIVGAELL
jgi:hypothetical protein